MTIPRDLTQIDETVLDIQIWSVDVENTFKRHFTWYIASYNSTNCTIQLVWDSPPWISSTATRDKLLFRVLRQDRFIDLARRRLAVDSENTVVLTEQGTWEIELPPQMYPGDLTENLATATETSGEAIKFWVAAQIVAQPFILASLSMLWGLINGLQVLAYLMLFNIPIPANVLIVNAVFYEIATFDVIPLDWLTDYIDE